MTKELYKAIMKRSNLHKKFLLWKMRREYFANIKINNIADNKKKPFFSDTIIYLKTKNLIEIELLYLMIKKLQKH